MIILKISYFSKEFICCRSFNLLSHLILVRDLWGRYYYHFNFGCNLTLIYVTRSQEWEMIESELKPRYSDGKVHAHDCYALSVLMCPLFKIYAHPIIHALSWASLHLCTLSSRHRPLLPVLESFWYFFINVALFNFQLCFQCHPPCPHHHPTSSSMLLSFRLPLPQKLQLIFALISYMIVVYICQTSSLPSISGI